MAKVRTRASERRRGVSTRAVAARERPTKTQTQGAQEPEPEDQLACERPSFECDKRSAGDYISNETAWLKREWMDP